jgi:hypothetical protein
MAKGSSYGDSNETVSFRLYPAELDKLRKLAHKHGGIGRAIQVAIELLISEQRKIELETEYFSHLRRGYDRQAQVVLSFTAPLRVRGLLGRYGLRHHFNSERNEVERSAVVRACIKRLQELRDENEFIEDPAYRLDT